MCSRAEPFLPYKACKLKPKTTRRIVASSSCCSSYCWWRFNPANHQLRLVVLVYPIIYRVLYIQTVVGNGISATNSSWTNLDHSKKGSPAFGRCFFAKSSHLDNWTTSIVAGHSPICKVTAVAVDSNAICCIKLQVGWQNAHNSHNKELFLSCAVQITAKSISFCQALLYSYHIRGLPANHGNICDCPSKATIFNLSSMQISRTQNVPGSSHPFDRKGQCQSNVGLSSKRLIHCGNGGFVKSDKTSNENSNRNLWCFVPPYNPPSKQLSVSTELWVPYRCVVWTRRQELCLNTANFMNLQDTIGKNIGNLVWNPEVDTRTQKVDRLINFMGCWGPLHVW